MNFFVLIMGHTIFSKCGNFNRELFCRGIKKVNKHEYTAGNEVTII